MKKILIIGALLLCTGCSVTITRTTINIHRSDNISIESLQEQKSDTTADTQASAKIGAI